MTRAEARERAEHWLEQQESMVARATEVDSIADILLAADLLLAVAHPDETPTRPDLDVDPGCPACEAGRGSDAAAAHTRTGPCLQARPC